MSSSTHSSSRSNGGGAAAARSDTATSSSSSIPAAFRRTALLELLAPDGYYAYLGVTKPSAVATSSTSATAAPESSVDADAIKKNYRRLSLRHHPDKGGDVDTFRLLNRAQKVLTNPKLRLQYVILGVDLDDEDDDDEDHRVDDDVPGGSTSKTKDTPPTSSTQAIIQEIASSVLAVVIQVGFRTAIMGTVSVVIARFWWSFYPALCFFAFIGVRLLKKQPPGSVYDTLPPVLIATGVCIMYSATTKNDNYSDWNKQFWFGEALVIGMFLYNSLGIPELQRHGAVLAGVAGCSLLSALWLRGRFWNYALVLILIAVVAILVALAFPLMEILLEAIINEKLRKVGDKVRHHHQVLQQHYEQQARKENR